MRLVRLWDRPAAKINFYPIFVRLTPILSVFRMGVGAKPTSHSKQESDRMTEERPFRSAIKVVTRNYGISNDPSNAANTYAVASYAPSDVRILMLDEPRLVTSGAATFLVGIPETTYNGVTYALYPDTDMNPGTLKDAVIWINCADIISVIEEG